MNMCRFLEIHLFVAALLQTVFATRSDNIELLLLQYRDAYRENQDNAKHIMRHWIMHVIMRINMDTRSY